jgi:hypothetical protein
MASGDLIAYNSAQPDWQADTTVFPRYGHRRTAGEVIMNRGRPTASKRQKEKEREEWRKKKDERRALRKQDQANRPPAVDGEDPDIAGIVPGPQPTPDFLKD